MKALTVQQPWAWAIVHGGKAVENRQHLWKYRGPLAIHAGRTWSDHGDESGLVHQAVDQHEQMRRGVQAGRLQRHWFDTSAVIGVVDLVDAHVADNCCTPWGENPPERTVHLVLANPRPTQPIPCSGKQGLWAVPEYVMLRLKSAGVV